MTNQQNDEVRKTLADFLKFGTLSDGSVSPNALNTLERFIKHQVEYAVAEARVDERNMAIQELRNEYKVAIDTKALTPEGINGYWSALRDFNLNNSDRIAALRGKQ